MNTNALFKNNDSDADGHAGLATRMKGRNLCNRVKIYEVDTSELGLISNKFKKDGEFYDVRSTPTMIEWDGKREFLLEKEDKIVLSKFSLLPTPGCKTNQTMVPKFTLNTALSSQIQRKSFVLTLVLLMIQPLHWLNYFLKQNLLKMMTVSSLKFEALKI